MFDSLLGQDEVCETLRHELERNELPSALLFTGPAFTGKLTAGLELARALNCRLASADCQCVDCRQHRALAHPCLLLLGSCELGERYQALTRRLQQHEDQMLTAQWWQLLRQLLLRFSPLLWGNRGQTERVKKALQAIESIGEYLLTAEGATLPPDLASFSRKVMAACQGLSGSSPISHIRRLLTWAQQSSDRYRVALITGADKLSEPASNALLKILEEPPPRFVLLLTSRMPRSIPQTLHSRLRNYRFAARTPEVQQSVLSRFFGVTDENGLAGFFSPTMEDAERSWAEALLEHLRDGRSYGELAEEIRQQPLDALVSSVSQLLRECPWRCGLEWRQAWAEWLGRIVLASEYNLAERSTLRDLCQQMGRVRMIDDR